MALGTLALGNDNALGAKNGSNVLSGNILAMNNGTVTASGAARTIANPLNATGSFTIGGSNGITFSGAVTNSGGNRTLTVNNAGFTTLSGTVNLANDDLTSRILTIGGTGNALISGVIKNNSGANTVASSLATTSGYSGTLTLNNANTYTGGTNIAGGTLVASNTSALGSGALSIGNGATLSSTGPLSVGAITLNGNSSTIILSAPANQITSSGALSILGLANSLNVGGTTIAGNIYTLVSSTGVTGSDISLTGTAVGNATVPLGGNVTVGRTNYEFTSTGTALQLSVTGGPFNLTWNGGNANWNTTDLNWQKDGIGSNIAFVINDNVTISTGDSIAVDAGGISAGALLVNNTAGTATLSGGAIITTGLTTKSGAGALVLSSTTTLGNGLGVTDGSLISNAAMTISAGGLGVSAGSATLNNSSSISGGIAVSGGSAALNAANTVSGAIAVSGGTLSLGASNAAGAGASSLTVSGGTLDIGANNQSLTNISLTSGSITGTSGVLTALGSAIDLQAGSVSAILGGTVGLTKTTSGTVTLSGANNYTGATTVNAGTLQLGASVTLGTATALTLGGGALDLGTTSQTVGAVSITAAAASGNTIGNGSLTGTSYAASNAAGTATVAANLLGSTSLTKSGAGGTLKLTGNNSYAGTTTISSGILEIGSGGVVNGGALTAAADNTARLLVSGGSFTASGTSTITGISTNNGSSFLMTSGSATFGTIQATVDGSLIRVDAGVFAAGNVNLVRTNSSTSAASTTSGFYMTGGTANLTTLGVATGNSSASVRVDGGTLNVINATVANQSTATRGAVLEVRGGNFNVSDATNGLVVVKNNGGVTQTANVLLSGGITSLSRLTYGFDNTVVTGSAATVTLSNSAALYLGGGGIVKNATNLTSTFNLTNTSILGASADWSASHAIVLADTPVIQAANTSNVAHNISLSGILSGTGSLTKTGGGTLTLGGPNNYTGATAVNAGTLNITGSITSAVTVNTTSTLAGTGTVTGNVQVTSGGHFAKAIAATVGAQVPLTITGTLTIDSGSILDLTAAAAPADGIYKLATTTGGVTYIAGTVNLTGVAGTVSVSGDGKDLLLTVASGSGYAAYASSHGLSAVASEDTDADGVSNGVEYFMGAAVGFTANPGIVSGKVTWPKDPAFSGTYTVQTSPDLGTWTNVSSTVVGDTVEYTVPTGQDKLFVRLDVTPN